MDGDGFAVLGIVRGADVLFAAPCAMDMGSGPGEPICHASELVEGFNKWGRITRGEVFPGDWGLEKTFYY